tara:strand:- start:192 stop:1004 length:813 start_codon:yes stop_codon:yes gene_type:complete
MDSDLYDISLPKNSKLPLLLSVPHAGEQIPADIAEAMTPEATALTDTDWKVHELYDFATDMGISIIKANLSRYVVDLNRPAGGGNLYKDGRQETTVVPVTTFEGLPLYREKQPDATELNSRVAAYHKPYYDRIHQELQSLRSKFNHVLFFDAHSIKRQVKRLQQEPFPDLILGDRDQTSAHPGMADLALERLRAHGYQTTYNKPFKGGNLTQNFGKPSAGIHALQLEMSQDIYLDTDKPSPQLHKEKGKKLSQALQETLKDLIKLLEGLK